jgi:hypothetical protein
VWKEFELQIKVPMGGDKELAVLQSPFQKHHLRAYIPKPVTFPRFFEFYRCKPKGLC